MNHEWTAIGVGIVTLLITLVSGFTRLERRLTRMETLIEETRDQQDQQRDASEERLRNVETRCESLFAPIGSNGRGGRRGC